MSKLVLALAAVVVTALAACSHTPSRTPDDAAALAAPAEVLLASDVEWEQLNPARGDKSPRAGTLWGDRRGAVPTGFLVAFVDGFSSPPHIHNVSYRGVVISGLVHNDDPDAAPMWMPPGSFWTQPKGEVHITAAQGSTNVAYIEIEEGPYLVLPVERAFDSGERPVNVDASNIVWVDPSGASGSHDGTRVAFLWGHPDEGRLNGTLVKLPPGAAATLRCAGSTFRAVVIRGRPALRVPGAAGVESVEMEPGSSFRSRAGSAHLITSDKQEDCILYVRANARLDVQPAPRE